MPADPGLGLSVLPIPQAHYMKPWLASPVLGHIPDNLLAALAIGHAHPQHETMSVLPTVVGVHACAHPGPDAFAWHWHPKP